MIARPGRAPSLFVLFSLATLLLSGANHAHADGAVTCTDGMAGEYACHNVDLLAHVTLEQLGGDGAAGVLANDVWGWTSPESGRNYVMAGLRNGTAFVDITDPVNPVVLGTLPSHQAGLSDYRDIKVYDHYAFIVADVPYDAHGMQVFDLLELDAVSAETATTPRTFIESAHYDGIAYGHNLWINEDTGFAYIFRSDTCEQATHIVDIRDPLNPVTAGSGDGCFVSSTKDSDAECILYDGPDDDYAGREICVTGSDETVTVGDVTDKDAPQTVAVVTYPNIRRAHQGAFTPDLRYVLISDTMDEMMLGFPTRTHLIDMLDLDAPVYLGYFENSTTSGDHNVYIPTTGEFDGRYAVQTNWRSGLRILNITDIPGLAWEEVAYFDTHPESDNVGAKSGSWSSYPWFESSVVAVNDVERGLFLLQPNLEAPSSAGLSGGLASAETSTPLWSILLLLALVGGLVAGAIASTRRCAR